MNHKQIVGRYGEDLALEYLKKKGYKITDRNLKISYQEIDIIAKIKEKIVLIEVKTRVSKYDNSAEENFSRRKINNLIKALEIYTARNKINPENTRLDLITIDINKAKKIAKIKHYKDVF